MSDKREEITLSFDELSDLMQQKDHQIAWLENRYKLAMKIMSDSVAATLPLDLQQKLYLDVARRTKAVQDADLTRKT